MDIINFLTDNCNIFDDNPSANNKFVAAIKVARLVVQIFQIIVPIALII